MSTKPSVLVPVIAVFVLGIMVIWAVTGGLWQKKAPKIDFQQIYQQKIAAATSEVTDEPGAAERIQNYLFKGTDIPGFSVAPPVTPNERQKRERARLEAEKPLRLATQSRAIEDLRRRLGNVSQKDITLRSWSERTWMDTALGCANPGEVLAPAKLPGWMFVFGYAGDPRSFFIYNATRDGRELRFCRREKNSTEVV